MRAAGDQRVASISGDLRAEGAAVPQARHLVEDFARRHGADDDLCARVALAASEAVSNVVRHAYAEPERGHRRGLIHYAVGLAGGDLELVVLDDGGGIRPDAQSDGAGLGLRMIAQLADDFAIRARRRGLEVWMRFALGACT